MQEMGRRALELGVPLSAQLDVTYRCNERCVHCYLDHDDHGELTTAEIRDVLDQLAEAGVFFLVLSGGEVLMRMDFFPILEHARSLLFDVKIKTNAFMIQEKQADRIRALGVRSVQVSIYSHRPEVHDAITKLPGSLKRSIAGIRFLQSRGLKVIIANVLMRSNLGDYAGVKGLAQELGAEYTIDPTITPKMDGDRSILPLGIGGEDLRQVFRNGDLVGNVEEFCAPPPAVDDDVLDGFPCSAGHTACYISPYGDVYPCVQFPLPTGNVRKQKFLEIWRHSPQMNEVRAIHGRQLPVCSTCTHLGTCTRCPGLAYMEGNMHGPSSQDCEKSFARTGIPSANMILKNAARANPTLVQIAGVPQSQASPLSRIMDPVPSATGHRGIVHPPLALPLAPSATR
jgi:radical SAM protein with 4Fe4S-binding SPASM domain